MTRRKSTPYSGDNLCEYCDKHVATHILVNGKYCCASTAGNCRSIRERAGKRISESRNSIEPITGLKRSKLIADKIAENKSNNIDENGENGHTRSGRASAISKYNDVDSDGKNAHQRNGEKFSRWCSSTIEGAKFREDLSRRGKEVMTYDEARRRSMLAVETRLRDVDDFGLNGFDRRHLKSKNAGWVEGIFYQSNNEKRFLENMVCLGLITNVKRGPGIKYMFNGEQRTYIADYVIGNSLYEIKSKYTWHGVDNCYLEMNIAKMEAAKNAGFECFVVIDDLIIKYGDDLIRESLRSSPYPKKST